MPYLLQGRLPEFVGGGSGSAEEVSARRGKGAGVSGVVWRRWGRSGEASAAAEAHGSAAVVGVPATGAGEEREFGELVRAAQATKRLGEKPRSKRRKRRIRRRLLSPAAHAGEGHPPRWLSAGRREVGMAWSGGCCCWGGSGMLPEVQGGGQSFQKQAPQPGARSGSDELLL